MSNILKSVLKPTLESVSVPVLEPTDPVAYPIYPPRHPQAAKPIYRTVPVSPAQGEQGGMFGEVYDATERR